MLTFTEKSLRILLAGLLVLFLTGTGVKGEETKKINVLFIMTDQQRWNAMSCAGNSVLQTPNLDRIASEGVRFANAYSNSPECVPARTLILTGRDTYNNHVTGNKDLTSNEVPHFPTSASILRESGYKAEYYGKWHVPYQFAGCYNNEVRVVNGGDAPGKKIPTEVDAYRDFLSKNCPDLKPGAYTPDPMDGSFHKEEVKGKGKPSVEGIKKISQAEQFGCLEIPPAFTRAALTAKDTLEAMDRLKGGPFFLTCSFDPPHPPMIIPKPYFGMYPPETLTPSPSIQDPLTNSPYENSKKSGARFGNPELIRYMMSDYYGMVKEIDDWIGKILDHLDELGLKENTLVIFTSDHGEMLGDHGMDGKWIFYEGSAHIPMLMRLPGVIPAGKVVQTPVSQIDFFSTILDYTGEKPRDSDGRSLRSLIEGKGDGGLDYCISQRDEIKRPSIMIRSGDWKLITTFLETKEFDALYNLAEDPEEMNNLIGKNPNRAQYAEKVSEFQKKILAWMEKTESPKLEEFKKHRF